MAVTLLIWDSVFTLLSIMWMVEAFYDHHYFTMVFFGFMALLFLFRIAGTLLVIKISNAMEEVDKM